MPATLRGLLFLGAAVLGGTYWTRCESAQLLRDGQREGVAFRVSDYQRVRRVESLAISSDGEYVAFVETHCLSCSGAKEVYVSGTARGSVTRRIAQLDGATQLAWLPQRHALAALLPRNGHQQVYAYDMRTRAKVQLSHAREPIVYFQFSKDGTLAFLTKDTRRESEGHSLWWRLNRGANGVVINTDRTLFREFLSPAFDDTTLKPFVARGQLWVEGNEKRPVRLRIPGDVRSFAWNPDSRYIVVTYVAHDAPHVYPALQVNETSVGVVDAERRAFHAVAHGIAGHGSSPGLWYAAGSWTRDGREFVLLRITQTDWGYSLLYPEWTLVSMEQARAAAGRSFRSISWAVAYPAGLANPNSPEQYIPAARSALVVPTSIRGRYGLYSFSGKAITPSAVVRFSGDASEFAFSDAMRVIAFVGEDLADPPEIYIVHGGGRPCRLTSINLDLRRALAYRGIPVDWIGAEGERLSGWLLKPKGPARKWPLLTYVHGGPGFPMTDGFAVAYFGWPSPLEALASHGIAVFEPNYPGTLGFGRSTQPMPGRPFSDSVQDIILGIRYIEHTGIVDAGRLGISGPSWGGTLGPMVMARLKSFRATSFAVGTADLALLYMANPGQFDEDVLDRVFGGSYYDHPNLYLKNSSDFRLRGVSTPMLIEDGAWDQPFSGLVLAKAARHFGEPAELVIYPRTLHWIGEPALAHESAERNYAWFEFWLNGSNEEAGVSRAEWAHWQQWRSQ